MAVLSAGNALAVCGVAVLRVRTPDVSARFALVILAVRSRRSAFVVVAGTRNTHLFVTEFVVLKTDTVFVFGAGHCRSADIVGPADPTGVFGSAGSIRTLPLRTALARVVCGIAVIGLGAVAIVSASNADSAVSAVRSLRL